ncbi:Qat anti-phage system TatD family nuclease QatD [Sinorhizobium meliloti]|uniref:Qat anti-phage system TatD family nuclease QatD n=1 Tax=Rhizobium meliloti TaxID=382 RepID=UPI000B49FE7D|nr:Qat anti-phage system TatD family nuclease QatD [Sinorhizobium meliloti]ASP68620.1 TatD family deoxyribonuclease [Sinorhizobium meliloti]MQX04586.1 TatD family deoxyribonuclease [Sinorhizobium meliloti]RVE96435.1 TatD family deoxyribonuclease [Sinorhizobium meliloti]RVK41464.1 TatD family deoxyribonuclease [Sinorhizobium meliloti]
MAKLVDFHCHLDLYPDFEALVRECESREIYTLAVTTTPRAWARNHELASRTKHVRAALGLHPQLVHSHGADIAMWERLLHESSYVGEVGLDAGPQYYRSLPEQKLVFERVLKACTRQGGKVLSIHSIRTASAVLDMALDHLDLQNNTMVMHWFTGTPAEARRAADMGCYFSMNARMLRSSKANALVKAIPVERMLTETDGPFTDGKAGPARPGDALSCVEGLAGIYGIPVADMQRKIVGNLLAMLKRTSQ